MAHPVWRRARPTGQRAPSSLAAVVVCWRADVTARIAPRRLPTASSPLACRVRTDALCSADLGAWPARTRCADAAGVDVKRPTIGSED